MKSDRRPRSPLLDERKYQLLVENITDYAISMLDADGVIVSWNAGAERFTGYAADEIVGEHFSIFHTDADKDAGLPERELASAVAEGRFEHEGWRLRKDGRRFWAHVIIDPVRERDGSLIGFAKITRDLSEKHEADRALRASDEQFRLLVQSVTDYAIFMLDPHGLVSNWNIGAQHIKGYLPKDIIGRHFSVFYTPEDRAAGEPQRALKTAATEGRYTKEGWRVRQDGTRFWASVVIDPIWSDEGGLLGFAKVTRDFTERREKELQLERTREALFQSQKLEAIGHLTGGVAHDFNNLLGAIMGSIELALKRIEGEGRVRSLLENAMQAATRGAALTQRMLAFARRQELKMEAVGLRELVESMIGLLARSLGPEITVQNRIPNDLPAIHTDANQLEMAVLNLATNARDAMPKGGSLIFDARLVSENLPDALDGANEYICLSVADTGIGMDKETLSKASDPFFTTKGVGKGTGLGLSMIQGLAQQSGGMFKLESEVGKGTRAELWIPAAAGAVPDSSDEKKKRTGSRRSLRILAVDDDPLVLINTVAMLEELGHEVAEQSSGEAALKFLEDEDRIDLLVTDQAMPKMRGLELAQKVQNRWPDTKIIIATGYGELPADSNVRFVRLSKPFLEQDLAEAIEEVTRPATFAGRVRSLFTGA